MQSPMPGSAGLERRKKEMKMGEDISGKGKSLATTIENQTDGSEDSC